MQIFTPSADTRLRLFVSVVIVLILGSLAFLSGHAESSFATMRGWVREQPVPFSHEHHVAGLGLDCRYCHTNVEDSAHAGFPPTHTCMTCHSQLYTDAAELAPVRESMANNLPIRWNRVSALPDYVYFNHSIHIDRGIACVECHGRVDRMPITFRAKPFQMEFCLGCHRDPAPHLRPPNMTTVMDWGDWQEKHPEYGAKAMAAHNIEPEKLVSCTTCHR